MVKMSFDGFKDVTYKPAQLHIKTGGLLKKEQALTTKHVDTGKVDAKGRPVTENYIKLTTREVWIRGAILGLAKDKKDKVLQTGIIDELRQLSNDIYNLGSGETCPANDSPDPMEEMMPFATSVKKEKRKKEFQFEPRVHTLTMPDWPPEAVTGHVTTRNIRIFIEAYNQLWLHQDDIDWMLRYIYIQQQLKGVDVVASDDEGPDAGLGTDAAGETTPHRRIPSPQDENHTPKKLTSGGSHLFEDWETKP